MWPPRRATLGDDAVTVPTLRDRKEGSSDAGGNVGGLFEAMTSSARMRAAGRGGPKPCRGDATGPVGEFLAAQSRRIASSL